VAFLAWVFLVFGFGAADRILVLWGIGYDTQLYLFRVGIWVLPAILFFVTRRLCRELRAADRIEAAQHAAEEEAEHERAVVAGPAPG